MNKQSNRSLRSRRHYAESPSTIVDHFAFVFDENSILVPRGRTSFGQHQESRPLAKSNTGKSAIHGLPVSLRMFRVKFDKSDWFWSQSIVVKNGMSLDQARGRDSWC